MRKEKAYYTNYSYSKLGFYPINFHRLLKEKHELLLKFYRKNKSHLKVDKETEDEYHKEYLAL